MRFDEVSARYAEFGPFVTGLVLEPAETLRRVGPDPPDRRGRRRAQARPGVERRDPRRVAPRCAWVARGSRSSPTRGQARRRRRVRPSTDAALRRGATTHPCRPACSVSSSGADAAASAPPRWRSSAPAARASPPCSRRRASRRSSATSSTSGAFATTATASRRASLADLGDDDLGPLQLAWGVAKAPVLRARRRDLNAPSAGVLRRTARRRLRRPRVRRGRSRSPRAPCAARSAVELASVGVGQLEAVDGHAADRLDARRVHRDPGAAKPTVIVCSRPGRSSPRTSHSVYHGDPSSSKSISRSGPAVGVGGSRSASPTRVLEVGRRADRGANGRVGAHAVRLHDGAVGPGRPRSPRPRRCARPASTPVTAASRPGRSCDDDLDAAGRRRSARRHARTRRGAAAGRATRRGARRLAAGLASRYARGAVRIRSAPRVADEAEGLAPALLDERAGAARPVSSGWVSTLRTRATQLVEAVALPRLEVAERERQQVERPGPLGGREVRRRAGAPAPRRARRGGRRRRAGARGRRRGRRAPPRRRRRGAGGRRGGARAPPGRRRRR